MAVYISGTVLASLFYDHSVSFCDQRGFLVGDVVNHVTDTISDSQINNSEVETRLYVYDSIPSTADRNIFDSQGNISELQVLDLLKGKHQSIVGWYGFRRGSSMRPSFRERLIHKNLALHISSDHPSDFVFMLCTSKFSSNFSTHSYDHGFLKLSNNIFKKVPMMVVNLGDTTHKEYHQIPNHTVSSSSGIYSLIVKQHEQEFLNAHGQVEINQITALSKSLHRQLQCISKDVVDSENQLTHLELEVSKYRKEVKFKQLEQAAASSNKQKNAVIQKADISNVKQSSVDELLSMEDEPVTVTSTPNFDKTYPVLVSGNPKSSCDYMNNSQLILESDLETKNNNEIKLTVPVALHVRDDKKDDNILSVSKSESGEPELSKGGSNEGRFLGQKSSDPFSFVSNMMQDSKVGGKVNTRSRSAMEVPKCEESKRQVSESYKVQSEGFFAGKHVKLTRKKSDPVSAAVIERASATCSNGERSGCSRLQEKAEGQKEKLSGKTEAKVDGGFNDRNDKKKNKPRRSGDTAKHCSQEVDEDCSQSSQDNYDMDVSSSPVF